MHHSSSNTHSATTGFPFHLRVVEAKGLHGSRRDIADPFVVVKLKGLKHIFNSEKQATDIKMNNEHPVFNQDFVLHPKENDTILVKVMDKNTPINRKLGKVLINVQSYLNRDITDSWFPLEGKAEKGAQVRLLMNYGSKATGFANYHGATHGATGTTHGATNLGTKSGATAVANAIAHSGHHEGTTTIKETEVIKTRDAHHTAPVVPVPHVAPVAHHTAPVVPMQNLNINQQANTTVRGATNNVIVNRDVVVQEKVHPIEEEVIQPVIHRERQQTEVHRVTQNINETSVLPTVVQEKVLAAEYRDFKQRDILAEESNSKATITSSVDVDQVKHIRIVKEPIIEETIRKTIIEVIQPVIHKEVTAPVLIKETLPIYEKVIEEPTIFNKETLATTTNVSTQRSVQQTNMLQQTNIQQTMVQPATLVVKEEATVIQMEGGHQKVPPQTTSSQQAFVSQ